jgi:ATP-binding cassette subfamily C protein
MMSSFGPVLALSALSSSLSQTLASGERVLDLMKETPAAPDVTMGQGAERWDGHRHFRGAEINRVTFAYDSDVILKDFSLLIWPNRIIGIHGQSGSGKSTVLKLLMRFWDVEEGRIRISDEDIQRIPTHFLREAESYMTQETHMFRGSIASNILIGKPGASRAMIVRAAKKASIHDFIESLPRGYDTPVGELGDTISDGERQRIGLARAFLHNAPLMLLDEPTSNLDSLNEAVILRSLREECRDKTVVVVSHRDSTMNVADTIFEMDSARES